MTRPAIFSDLAFDAALAESKSANKLLLVDATASWCAPCHVMDQTTWTAPTVVDALRERALAIQIDVDAEKDVAAKLAIKPMPTVVAFRDGLEIDRITGLENPTQLLAWLDGLARGETSLDAVRAEAAARPEDMQARMTLARKLVDSGRLPEATTEYVWLWEHMLEQQPAMYGVKYSFLVAELERLVAAHRPAHDAFTRLRDEVAPR